MEPDVLEAMNRTILHRGPDSAGRHLEPSAVGMAMRRLAIIDVGGGDQPIANESVWIVFNGEIYNFLSLREELEARGHCFRTRTDTEVVVHAYEEYKQIWAMVTFMTWHRDYLGGRQAPTPGVAP